MSQFYSVFMHPTDGPYKRCCHGSTLVTEARAAKDMDAEHYLYSRTSLRIPMATGKRYKLTWSLSSGRFGYVMDGHHIRGAFDYFNVNLDGKLIMDVEHPVPMPGLGITQNVPMALSFGSARSLKFIDFTKQYECCIEIKDSKFMLVFYDLIQAVVEVELNVEEDKQARWAS
ncbi:hypothetical protein YA0089_26655 [Pseudomonas viridiflava]|uniref:hypothetical protein n=1 Tax=Pseudomonas viridiflava TaxID=33069 RepID=UPI0018E5B831|nr:hypothetical protein [Pseudomonas viridiflava]MBI6727199.1 hypothetical protein [Pseudomonas viridiflava]